MILLHDTECLEWKSHYKSEKSIQKHLIKNKWKSLISRYWVPTYWSWCLIVTWDCDIAWKKVSVMLQKERFITSLCHETKSMASSGKFRLLHVISCMIRKVSVKVFKYIFMKFIPRKRIFSEAHQSNFVIYCLCAYFGKYLPQRILLNCWQYNLLNCFVMSPSPKEQTSLHGSSCWQVNKSFCFWLGHKRKEVLHPHINVYCVKGL